MKSPSYADRKLEDAFRKSFDGIFRIFGETTKETLLVFLEERYFISSRELVRKPDLLEEGLKEAFRSGGWMLIKQMLLRELYSELQVPGYEDNAWTLSKHLENIRTFLELREA